MPLRCHLHQGLPLERQRKVGKGRVITVIVLLVEVSGSGIAIMPPAHIPDTPPESKKKLCLGMRQKKECEQKQS